MGAFYMGRDPAERGNVIRHNFWHHIGRYGLVMAVYLDDGACGTEVTGNVFYKAGSRTVMVGGGSDNPVRNNIFINSALGVHLDNRLQGWAKGNVSENGLFATRLKAVRYDREPWRSRYPQLAKYFGDNPALPKRNPVENNVFVDTRKVHSGSASWGPVGTNYVAKGDAGFANAAAMNFGLRKDSEVFKKLPGFKAIPFERIGLVADEYRRTLLAEQPGGGGK